MNIHEALAYISSRENLGIKPGLESIGALCAALGNPQKKCKCVHVAGTNAKGSVCAFLESILCECGISVGVYTSPAVFSPLEIIRLNGAEVEKTHFCRAVEKISAACESLEKTGIYPTLFEIQTAAAFLIFAEASCDICVIECGMGGALDATNILENSLVSVITPISAEHCGYLGNTIAEIASAKGGIIRENGYLYSATQCAEAETVLKKICAEKNCELTIIPDVGPDDIFFDCGRICFESENFGRLNMRMCGINQPSNALLAASAAKRLADMGYKITDAGIAAGTERAELRGRFEICSLNPTIILDGAHNPQAAASLCRSLKLAFGSRKFLFVVGFFKDKNHREMLELFAPHADGFICVPTKSERAFPAAALKALAAETGIPSFEASDMREAAKMVLPCGKDICVCGSFSILKEFSDIKENGTWTEIK